MGLVEHICTWELLGTPVTAFAAKYFTVFHLPHEVTLLERAAA